jgi:hypothetical protein
VLLLLLKPGLSLVWIFGGLFMFGTVQMGLAIAQDGFRSSDASEIRKMAAFGIIALLCLIVGIYFYFRFRKARKEAVREMELAKGAYDEKWFELGDEMKRGLERLNKKFVEEKNAGKNVWVKQVQKFEADDSVCTAFGRKLHIHPAGDFVELYKQAHEVQHTLMAHAEAWAKKHGGTRKGGGVKDPKRALQKTFRSYGGDSRRLCDLARTTIVFRSFDDMADCLETITKSKMKMYAKISDKEQNRFNPRYSPVDGYRDLQLRINISNDLCEGHVCEIQMHIYPMHKLKNDEAHSKYKKFRDLTAK